MNALALQGGGCLGYGQVLILIELERQANRLCSDLFGFIGGTSVGAIIGSCLAIGIPASQIESFFTTSAPVIFDKYASWINYAANVWRPEYAAAPLETALQKVLGNAKLSDCKTKFIATSYDWSTDRPVYFKSYEKSSSDKNFIVVGSDSDICLWQVCRASSAAPTYFPAYVWNGMTMLDGGLAGDNVPDLLCASELLDGIVQHREEIKMLSLGSGDSKWKENPLAMVTPGLVKAGLNVVKIVFSAGEDGQIYKARQLLGANHFRLSPDLGDGIDIDDAAGCVAKIPAAVASLLATNEVTLAAFTP